MTVIRNEKATEQEKQIILKTLLEIAKAELNVA
ncbi:hypothetical protein FUSNEC_GEN_287_01490 [Fusobacterium necrophorum subsp. funduliforme]